MMMTKVVTPKWFQVGLDHPQSCLGLGQCLLDYKIQMMRQTGFLQS